MARKWFKQGSQRLRLFSKRRKSAGFTLIELLVAMVIASIITSILLFLVVQLLQTSQRESARSDTQREMQMALDYIGRDVREAVYVYDGKCLVSSPPTDGSCTGLLKPGSLPNAILPVANNLPVLAFWRVDPLQNAPKIDDLCKANAGAFSEKPGAAQDAALLPIKGIPCVSRRMYTLVVYSLNWDTGEKWSGRARIKRYQLPQYSYSAKTAAETTPGWLFPASGDVSFMTWPRDTTGKDKRLIPTPTSDPSNTQVLVDFVDQKGLSTSAANDAVCPAPVATAITSGYVLTPTSAKTPSADNNRGFYVCVKGGESKGNLNQEVSIFLQGNAAGRPGLQLSTSNVPISMQTRVMTRGALDKAI